MSILNKILKVGLIKVISIPLSLLLSIVLARTLGPQEFGLYAYIMALVTIFAIPVYGGLPQMLVRFVAEYTHQKKLAKLKGIIYFSIFWILCFSAGVLVIAYLVLPYFQHDIKQLNLLQVGAWLIPLLSLLGISAGILKGLKMPVYSEFCSQVLQPSVVLVCLFVFIFFSELTTKNALIAQLISIAFSFFILSLCLKHVLPEGFWEKKQELHNKKWFYSLIPFSLIVLANTFNTQIGILILGLYDSAEAVGGLRIAERAAQFVAISLGIVNSVYAPYIVNAYREQDKSQLQKIAKNIARGAFIVAAPIALMFFVYGDKIISTVFGSEYVELSYTPMLILVIAQLVNVFFGAVGNLLTMTGHEKITFKGQVIALSINIIACFVLIPIYGAVGAALGVSIGLVSWNIILFYYVRKKLNINAMVV